MRLSPNQAFGLNLEFPLTFAGQAVFVETMDGGALLPNSGSFIGADGAVFLLLQAGSASGSYRYDLICGDIHTLLNIQVDDPAQRVPDPSVIDLK